MSTALAIGKIIIFLCPFVVANASQPTLPDTTLYRNYSYIRFVTPDDTISLTDEQFYDISGKVVFPVNQYTLPKNDALLNELQTVVLPRVNSDSLELVRIVLRGAASPEGPYENNKKLGQKRVQALSDFIKGNLQFPGNDDALSVDVDYEDYRTLCIMMKRADDPDYSFVNSLCDVCLPANDIDRLKRALRAAQGGRLWLRLLNDYFPQLRAARIVLFFRKYQEPETVVIDMPAPVAEPQPEIVAPVIVPVIEQPIVEQPIVEEPATDTITIQTKLPRRELLSIKTNLLMYGAYIPGYDRWCPMPNVAIEYYPRGGHFTLGASFDMPWWQHYHKYKFFQFRNYQLETRYYLKSSSSDREVTSHPSPHTSHLYKAPAFSGLYVQAYAHCGLFGICFDANRGWVGEGAGAGLGIGYVTPISRNGHWRLEFGLQAGFFRCKYDPYKYENPVNPAYHDDLYYYKWTGKPEYFKKRQYRWSWLGPTRIGVTLTYDLLYRRIQKKGISFKNKERLKIIED